MWPEGEREALLISLDGYECQLGTTGEDAPEVSVLTRGRGYARGVISDPDKLHQMLSPFTQNEAAYHKQAVLVHSLRQAVDRSKVCEFLFETEDQERVLFGLKPTMACYASGRTTAVNIDFGHDLTQVVAHYEGLVLAAKYPGTMTCDLTGACDFPCNAEGLTLPDGSKVLAQLGFGALNSVLGAVEGYDLVYTTHDATTQPGKVLSELVGNIVVSGRPSTEPSMIDAFKAACVAGFDPFGIGVGVKVIAPPDRQLSAWIGGSIYGNFAFRDPDKTLQVSEWISKEQYAECGAPRFVFSDALYGAAGSDADDQKFIGTVDQPKQISCGKAWIQCGEDRMWRWADAQHWSPASVASEDCEPCEDVPACE